jgi:hypothetical protein
MVVGRHNRNVENSQKENSMLQNLIPGILFRIDATNSLHLREWVQETDWQIIASQIEKRGVAIVLDMQPDQGEFPFHLGQIREIPSKRGRYRPHYGNFGGGFEFCFRPQIDGIVLTASCLAKKAEGEILPSFKLHLFTKVELQIEYLYRTGLIYVHDANFTEGENNFGFFGEFYEKFRAWEWYGEDLTAFEFWFAPLSVGCLMRVLHARSGSLLDLTKDVDW